MKLTTRDLINVGIFGTLYIVLFFAICMIGVLGPLVNMVAYMVAVLACGTVYMLYLTKVKKPGMIALFSSIAAIIMLVTGHPWTVVPATLVAAGLAELCLRAGKYRSTGWGVLSYACFSLWMAGPMLPLFYAREAYLETMREQMGETGAQYVNEFAQLATAPFILALLVSSFVLALGGGWIGKKMLRKHFERAGIA